MDWNRKGKRIGVLLLFLIIAGAIYFWEEEHTRHLFAGITPFPEGDYWETLVNALLRDLVLLVVGALLFLRRKRIPDRLQRYAAAQGAQAALFGHTHAAFCEQRGGVWLLNPGRAGKGLFSLSPATCGLLTLAGGSLDWERLEIEES